MRSILSHSRLSKQPDKLFNSIQCLKLPTLKHCPKLSKWIEIILCCSLATLIFLNTLQAGFVYDDNRAILQNDDARWGSPIASLFHHDFWGTPLSDLGSHGSWRPLTTLSYRLNHLTAGGLKARDYHLTNVILHALVTGLFLVWARGLIPGCPAPVIAAILFSLHPIHCEAVAGLVGRAELGQALFTLIALILYREHCKCRETHQIRGRVFLILTVVLAVTATLFKEQGLVTLALCGASDLLQHSSLLDIPSIIFGSVLTPKLPRKYTFLRSSVRVLAAASLALVCARIMVAGGALPKFAVADNPAAHEPSVLTRFLTFLYLPAFNVGLFLCPVTLSFDWSMNAVPLIHQWQDPRNLASLSLYLSICLLLWKGGRSTIQALLLATLPFLPVSNLVGYVGFVAAERVLYTPSLGLCLLIGIGTSRLLTYSCRRSILRVMFVIVIVVLAARTWKRNQDWQSEETLYKSGLSINPPKAFGNLGSILASQGRSREAETCYRQALIHRPNMADVHYNLGLLILQTGGPDRLPEAELSLRSAIACRPKLAAAHVALAVTLARLGEREEAEAALSHAAQLDGSGQRDPRAHQSAQASALLHLGRMQLERRQAHDALGTLLKARDAMPPNYHQPQSVYNLLGEAYSRLGRPEQAEPWMRASLASHPDHIPAHLALARLLAANESRSVEAESWLHRALRLAPKDPAVLRGYGEFLLNRGRTSEASELLGRVIEFSSPVRYQDFINAATAHRLAGHLEIAEKLYIRARDLKPQEASSHGNLGACLHLAGKYKEAEQSYKKALDLEPGDPVTVSNLQRLKRLIKQQSGT